MDSKYSTREKGTTRFGRLRLKVGSLLPSRCRTPMKAFASACFRAPRGACRWQRLDIVTYRPTGSPEVTKVHTVSRFTNPPTKLPCALPTLVKFNISLYNFPFRADDHYKRERHSDKGRYVRVDYRKV